MVKHLSNLYKMIKDHYDDAYMHYEYAEEACEDGKMEFYRFHLEEGLSRIERMKNADRFFRKMASEHTAAKASEHMLWKHMYDDLIEDAEELEEDFRRMKSKA